MLWCLVDSFEKVINVALTVSVIIPVFNMESMIRTTLDDRVHQKNVDMEILAIDDGSTDGSPGMIASILRNYHGPYSLLTLGENQGASNARNTGIDALSGKFVFFIDGGDRMSEGTLDKLVALAENNGADFAFSGFRVCGPDLQGGKVYSLKGSKDSFYDPGEVLHYYLSGKRFVNASNALYSRGFLNTYGIRLPRGCRFAESKKFIVKALFHAKRAAFTSEPLVSYIQHPKQTTNRPGTSINKYANAVGIYLRLGKYLKNIGAEEKITKLIDKYELPNAILKMATEIAKNGELPKFQKVINSSFIRQAIRPGCKTLLKKPEIAFRSWQALHAPGLLFKSYKGKE